MSLKIFHLSNAKMILGDGLNFLIVSTEKKATVNIKIGEALAKQILKTATGFQANVIAAYNNYGIQAVQKLAIVEDGDAETAVSVVADVNHRTSVKDIGFVVYGEAGTIELFAADAKNLLSYLEKNGAENDPTYGLYRGIIFTKVIPDTDEMMLDIAYMLTATVGDYPTGTVFIKKDGIVNTMDTETGELEPVPTPEPPGPQPEPDPEDASTIPDSEEKEPASGDIGGSDVAEAQVWDNAVSGVLNAVATEEISVVNSTLADGTLKLTIQEGA